MRIAYLINQYPKISHTFIRREIQAIEQLGETVHRFAIRGKSAELVDAEDIAERTRTVYLHESRFLDLIWQTVKSFLTEPRASIRALMVSIKFSSDSRRSLLRHLASLMQAFLLADYVRRFEIEHVHAHFATNSTEVAAICSQLTGVPYSFTVHGSDEWDMPMQLRLDHKAQHAKFIACVSSFTAAQLGRWILTSDINKIAIVRCSTPVRHGEIVPLSASSRTFLCVGRLCKEKNQPLLVKAFASVSSRHPDARLIFAGDGEWRVLVEDEIEKQGLRDKITITGWVSEAEIRALMRESLAVVMSSSIEGLPVVLLEAYSEKRPVISTWVGGIPELVANGTNGWLSAPGDDRGMADSMLACLSRTEEELRALAEAGHLSVLKNHDAVANAALLQVQFRR